MTTTDTDHDRRRWIAAAPGRGPTRSELLDDLDALGAELAVLAAAPGRRDDDGSARSKPTSTAPRRTGAAASARPVDDVLADADSIRDALADGSRAWWGSEGAQLARAVEAVRWDLDVARRGRTAAGDPPWHDSTAEAELRAEPDEPPPAPARASAEEGYQLRALREAVPLGQRALARLVAAELGSTESTTQRALSRMERGLGGPRVLLDAASRSVRGRM